MLVHVQSSVEIKATTENFVKSSRPISFSFFFLFFLNICCCYFWGYVLEGYLFLGLFSFIYLCLLRFVCRFVYLFYLLFGIFGFFV